MDEQPVGQEQHNEWGQIGRGRQSLNNVVADALRDAILTGQFKPGDRLPEPQLAEMFGVSRNPIREALQVLSNEGLVEISPRKGARVPLMSFGELAETIELRAELEGISARYAARHCHNQTRQTLTKLLEDGDNAAARGGIVAILEQLGERLPGLVVAVARRVAGADAFQFGAQFDGFGQLAKGHERYARALAGADFHQSFIGKNLQRLADGIARHAEHLGKLRFGKPVARFELPGQNGIAKRIRHNIVERLPTAADLAPFVVLFLSHRLFVHLPFFDLLLGEGPARWFHCVRSRLPGTPLSSANNRQAAQPADRFSIRNRPGRGAARRSRLLHPELQHIIGFQGIMQCTPAPGMP